jgi:hypothetical protein
MRAFPLGHGAGHRIELTDAQRAMIVRIYDSPEDPSIAALADPELSAHLALARLVGIKAIRGSDGI